MRAGTGWPAVSAYAPVTGTASSPPAPLLPPPPRCLLLPHHLGQPVLTGTKRGCQLALRRQATPPMLQLHSV